MGDNQKNKDSLVGNCKGYELEYTAIRDEVLNIFSARCGAYINILSVVGEE